MSGQEMEDIFFGMKREYDELFAQKQYDKAWDLCLQVWDKFPDPKYKESMSYLWIEDVINYAVLTKQFEYANKYVSYLFIANVIYFSRFSIKIGNLLFSTPNKNFSKKFSKNA